MKILSRFPGNRFALLIAGLVALVVMIGCEATYRQAASASETLAAQAIACTTIQSLWRSVIDAEAGQRGYLLTGNDGDLEPYRAGLARATESLMWLESYYAAEPRGRDLTRAVAIAARTRLSELAETLRLYDLGQRDALIDRLRDASVRQQMDSVRRLSQELLTFETQRVADSRDGVARTLSLNRLGLELMTLLCLGAWLLYLRRAAVFTADRSEWQREAALEHQHLEREVTLRTGQLTELARHLQTAREDERTRLARELHDELGALLTAAKLDVARLKSRLGALAPEVAERMQHLNDALNSGIALKRRIIEELRPSSLSNLGLVAALEILIAEWEDRTGISARRALSAVDLRPLGELTIYRLVQEALANTAKYADATSVAVCLSSANGMAIIRVEDNGLGFDISAVSSYSHGLLGLRYRVESEGGRMLLSSSAGLGTTVEARLPEISGPGMTAAVKDPTTVRES